MIHYYYGNGKGKTTAALGLALRAAGCGFKVVVVQFLKDWKCGELVSLEQLENITVFRGKASGGMFVRDMNEDQKAETKAIHDENLRRSLELSQMGMCDMLVLDEAADAYSLGVLDSELWSGLIMNCPESLELVVTGHMPDPALLEHADYVTEMIKHKHPYDLDVKARSGIEF